MKISLISVASKNPVYSIAYPSLVTYSSVFHSIFALGTQTEGSVPKWNIAWLGREWKGNTAYSLQTPKLPARNTTSPVVSFLAREGHMASWKRGKIVLSSEMQLSIADKVNSNSLLRRRTLPLYALPKCAPPSVRRVYSSYRLWWKKVKKRC